jgi:hypothetical protein
MKATSTGTEKLYNTRLPRTLLKENITATRKCIVIVADMHVLR